ncbi:MAG: exosortase/archaeosortase family protein [Candidatus Diapherotrites archaeon]|nr:exosortase/archaeosortase family protein [Candidatus Diapherotrites archaeon]
MLDWKAGAEFLAGILVLGTIVFAAEQVVMSGLQTFTAALSALTLSITGMTAFSAGHMVSAEGLTVQIIPLCVGDIELAVLVAAIASTADRRFRERAYGIIGGTIFVFAANALRVALTMLTGIWYGLAVMDLVHSVLFRITLVLVIVGYYAAWYLRLSGKPIKTRVH